MPPENSEISQAKIIEKAADVANLSPEAKAIVNLKTKLELSEGLGKFKDLYTDLTSIKDNPAIKEHASKSMSALGDVLNIQIPFLGSVGELFETTWPIQFFGKTKEERLKNPLFAMLKKVGFDFDNIHKGYIEEQIKGIDMNFAKSCFIEYQKSVNIQTSDAESTRNICGLEEIFKTIPETEKANLKAKIPQDFATIKKTLINQLPNSLNKLSINTVRMIDPSLIIMQDKKEVVDTAKIQGQPQQFIENYLKITVDALAKSGDKFINSENVHADEFTLALFGNLTGDKFFVEGVNLGVITKASILGTSTGKTETTEIDPNQAAKIKAELASVKNCPLTAEMIIKASKDYKAPIPYMMAIMKNDSTYGTAGLGAKTHNPGNVGNMDDKSQKDRGTREAGVAGVAKNLARRISEYRAIYGADKMPKLKELATNKGPDGKGFLSKQGNYKKENPNAIGAYMTSKTGQNQVQLLADNFTNKGFELSA
ncbi:MAG: hypothetical protein WCO66_04075 [Candidatus Absconditabacteria bacterium]